MVGGGYAWGVSWLILACTTDVQVAATDEAQSTQARLGLTNDEVADILDFLNDCEASFDVLDTSVGLDSDAAENLVEHRDGGDAKCGTRDDDAYDTLDEVDAVTQVGDQTILDILDYVNGGADGAGEWEGVSFTAAQQAAVLEIANGATLAELDKGADLPSDTAENIVDARPIDTMDALASVPEVGESALQKLKDYIAAWPG